MATEPTEPSDPFQEPENSTVENWHGQRVERDAELADEVVDESDDLREAERKFDERAEGPADRHGGEVS